MNGRFVRGAGRWLRVALFRDFFRKFLSLALAVLLYGAVTYRFSRAEPLRLSGVPVELQLPEGVVNRSQNVPQVTLVVTGSARMLNGLSARDAAGKVRIPQGSFAHGVPYRLKLSPRDFNVPVGIVISDVEPGELTLDLEPVTSRRVPVEAQFDSPERLPQDYQLDRVVCVPEDVSVSGPESVVGELRTVRTAPIPLDGTVTDGFDYAAQLRIPEGVKASPERITVRIEITRKYATRVFRDVPLRILLSSKQRRSWGSVELQTPSLAEVAISGPESQVAGLKTEDLRAYLDLTELSGQGPFSLVPNCAVAGSGGLGMQVRSVSPDHVTVRVSGGGRIR